MPWRSCKPCRQDLPREAAVDVQQLKSMEAALKRKLDSSERISVVSLIPKSIVAISHCWLSCDHPDPDGLLLAELAPVIRAYLTSFHTYDLDFGGAFFFAWGSLYQPFHAKMTNGCYTRLTDMQLSCIQAEAHQRALENMDIWYTHTRTEVWMLTKFFPAQVRPYDERGWPTWERTVAELLSDGNAVLDLGKREGCLPKDMQQFWEACIVARRPPLVPEEFQNVIATKFFTCGKLDSERITSNYQRNFTHALCCATSLDYYSLSWKHTDVLELSSALRICCNLRQLGLSRNLFGDDGACLLARSIHHCCDLARLFLSHCQIGDTGTCALAAQLYHVDHLEHVALAQNQIGDVGACALARAFCHCTKLEQIFLFQNEIGDVGAQALAQSFSQCTNLQWVALSENFIGDLGAHDLGKSFAYCSNLERLGLFQNQIGDAGACTLAEGLGCCGNLQRLGLSANKIGDVGARALAHNLGLCSMLERLNLSQNQIGDAGVVAVLEAFRDRNMDCLDLSQNQTSELLVPRRANA